MKIHTLPQNKSLCFIGVQLTGKGFVLSKEKAKEFIQKESKNLDCLKNFLIGRDLNRNWEIKPTRMVIDFQDWPLEKALQYKDLIEIVENTVKKERLESKSNGPQMKKIRKYWWHYQCLGKNMRKEIQNLDKFIVTSRTSKHRIFIMIKNKNILPDSKTLCVSSNSYSFLGILSSKFHIEWEKHNGGRMGEGLTYTNTTCFETFPFPEEKENEKVSSIMKQIESYRRKVCQEHQHGLTRLYNQMFEGKHPTLKELHTQLDHAVSELYHFPIKNLSSKKEILKHLIKLNCEFYEAFYGNSVS